MEYSVNVKSERFAGLGETRRVKDFLFQRVRRGFKLQIGRDPKILPELESMLHLLISGVYFARLK